MSERHRCNAQSQGAQRFLCRAPTHTTILHLCRLYRWGVIEAWRALQMFSAISNSFQMSLFLEELFSCDSKNYRRYLRKRYSKWHPFWFSLIISSFSLQIDFWKQHLAQVISFVPDHIISKQAKWTFIVFNLSWISRWYLTAKQGTGKGWGGQIMSRAVAD